MAPNTSEQQIVTNQNTPEDQISNSPASNQKGFIPLILGVVILLIVVAGGAYYLGTKNISSSSKQQSEQPTTSITVPTSNPSTGNSVTNPTKSITGTEIVSVDDKTNKYINHDFGFSIRYPKYNQTPSTCQERQADKTGAVPLKVFEVPNINTLYISEESVIEIKNKQVAGGGYQYDFSTCKVVPNSLDLIKNGYNNGMVDTNKMQIDVTRPSALQFNYQKVDNDNDLQTLAQSLYNGCYIGAKQLAKNSNDVYQIKLADKNGQNGNPESGCFTNFIYLFLYSPKNHVAVITSGFQNGPFFGTNEQVVPDIEFPTK